MGRFFSHLDAPLSSSLFLVLFFALFIGLIVYWYSPKRKKDTERFARMPLEDDGTRNR